MNKAERRLERERRTISVMIGMYCRGTHSSGEDLCAECNELRGYALARIEKCPFAWRKPVCAKCPVHCYQAEMRARVREVMRYSGPHMLLRHPVLALLHLLDGWGKPQQKS